MTAYNKSRENPLSQKATVQLSRRMFSQGLFVAGIAAASMPLVLPNATMAENAAGSQIKGSLRDAIDQQLMAFNGPSSLAHAVNDEAFLEFLGQRLNMLHPASVN